MHENENCPGDCNICKKCKFICVHTDEVIPDEELRCNLFYCPMNNNGYCESED